MVQKERFDSFDGIQVTKLLLRNEHMSVELLDYGATIHAIYVKDRNGEPVDVCLGYDTIEEYRTNDGYLGATVGRNANRIANAKIAINDKEYSLTANEGKNQLHGGKEGFDRKLWSFRCEENAVTFRLDSPDGEEGFPGNLKVEVTYRLEGPTLHLEYRAESDRDTVVNLTNHAYFNLGGQNSGRIDDHILKAAASRYTPVDDELIPTGEIAGVEGSALDLREGVPMSCIFSHTELAATNGLDHNFVLDRTEGPAATLWCPRTGIGMTVETTLEGLQIYSCGAMTRRNGKGGSTYDAHHAVCLETQHFPNAINEIGFPSPLLRGGEEYREKTSYSFFIGRE